jgi:protein-tyrosine-phosphatase
LLSEGVTEIQKHRVKKVTPELLESSDRILAADTKNKERALKQYPAGSGKVLTAREYAGLEGPEIKDAHYRGEGDRMYAPGIPKGSPEAYELMVAECKEVALKVLEKLGTELFCP